MNYDYDYDYDYCQHRLLEQHAKQRTRTNGRINTVSERMSIIRDPAADEALPMGAEVSCTDVVKCIPAM